VPGRASGVKMVGMAEMGAPISLDGVAVTLDCWCVSLCYLHFAPENPGEMYLLVPAPPGCPGQSPKSCKMVLCVCCVYGNEVECDSFILLWCNDQTVHTYMMQHGATCKALLSA